ncbi:MAG: hypothetical protein EXS55_01365 [Candidatus Magasanikbacteria bacterium]|nr:hypothetical protein [Candidatus Magasanikbacteria bacterium]
MKVKSIIKQFLPTTFLKKLRPLYHGAVALCAHYYFGQPSNKLIVIGVTGTNGKTTTVNLAAKILVEAGYKVGYSSTINFNDGGGEQPNTFKMTMPSGWLLHKWLATMVKQGVQYAVLEVSSEGLAQNRHLGINFDVALITNLTPEHIESHGGFEKYKEAKGILFKVLSEHPVKVKTSDNQVRLVSDGRRKGLTPPVSPPRGGITDQVIKKTIIVNADDMHRGFYNQFKAQQNLSYGVECSKASLQGSNVVYRPSGVSFRVEGFEINLQLKGQFDVYNALAATTIARSQNISFAMCKQALEKVPVVPGRVEVICHPERSEGSRSHSQLDSSAAPQNDIVRPFTVVVDYAYEPEEMRQLYETIKRWPHQGIVQILGATGGGRDKARIKILGKMAGEKARLVFITTDDPYDDDPGKLAAEMSTGSIEVGKKIGDDCIIELDRRVAIRRAFQSAAPGDIVLITGKGADQKMCLANGRTIDWDDRTVAREELLKMSKSK